MVSTAVRGTRVPPGAPGVWRVDKPGRRLRADAVGPMGWVQPADVTASASEVYVLAGETGNAVLPGDFVAESLATIQRLRTPNLTEITALIGTRMAGSGSSLQTPITNLTFIVIPSVSMPPTSPPPPSGMSVEYENPAGTFVSGAIDAVVARSAQPETATLRQVSDSMWDPVGTAYDLRYFTPAELSGFTELHSIPPAAEIAYEFTQPFTLDANDGFCAVLAYNKQVVGEGWIFDYGGPLAWDDILTTVSVTYTPPRYRFV
jgi:hypothetical protein